LGILLYEMLTGLPPFYDEDIPAMYQKILEQPLRFPDEVSPDARSLLTGLLTRDPAQRLGVNGAEEIKRHPFFAKAIDWKKLMQKKIQPPFKPSVVRVAIWVYFLGLLSLVNRFLADVGLGRGHFKLRRGIYG
jgi:serum/glucocorticoid-regulated kinase 2